MVPFPSPLKAQAFHAWASAVAFTAVEISLLTSIKRLNKSSDLLCYLRKLHTMILIIGSMVNMNINCILGI